MSDLDLTGYTLTFRDEFNAFSWNSNSDTSYTDQVANGTWSTRFWWGNGERNLPGNAEVQWYSDPSVGTNPFSIVDGALRITATPSTDTAATGNLPYVSGLITTDATFAQQYGYFEIRAKLPAGQGMWPQFWLLPQDHSWPPEIDPLEAFGSEPNRFHWATHTGPNNDGDGGWVDVLDDITNSFHTYGVKWTAETITYYFDGREVASVATPYDMHKPMYMLADLAIGGPWAGNPFPYTELPAHMDIDYIRAYSNDPSAKEAAPQAVSAPDDGPEPTAAAAARSAAPVEERVASNTLSNTAHAGTAGDDAFPTGYGDIAARSGGAGDDTYIVSDSRMPIVEKAGEGTDAVIAWMNYTLAPNVENIYVGANYGLHVQGNGLSNIMEGNAGADWINGRAGDDLLTGSGGNDTFLVNAGNGYDTVTDFQAGAGDVRDRLVLDGYGLGDFAAVKAALKQVGADAVLTMDNGETVTFRGVSASSFTAENFAFTRVSGGDGAVPTTPGPKPATPTALTAGAGADALVLKISQDAYEGSAQYTVSVDGAQVGGTFTASASRAAGQSDTLTLKGDWAAGPHTVAVNFLNDAWGGTAATDRNLHVDGATYNGQAVAGAAATLLTTGAASFAFTEAAAPAPATPATLTAGTGPDSLVLKISQDAYQGSAEYTVSVDGEQVGGTFTASALKSSGQSDTLTLKGDWGPGEHKVEVKLLNDAWGGSAETDRNLHVDGATYNGGAVSGAAQAIETDWQPGGFSFTEAAAPAPTPAPGAPAALAAGAGPDALVLKVSQDAYEGSAQYTVKVDGVQIGGTFTASASRAAGQSDTLTLKGDWAAGAHSVQVEFLNDRWDGTAATDRNLYVDSAAYNGQAVSGAAAALTSAGAKGFSFAEPAAKVGTADADLFEAGPEGGVFTGKDGRDLFVFEAGDGAVTITDFAPKMDKLVFIDFDRGDVATEAAASGPPGLLVQYGDGGTVFLAGISTLAERDMVFA